MESVGGSSVVLTGRGQPVDRAAVVLTVGVYSVGRLIIVLTEG